jgi:hypothetical protein
MSIRPPILFAVLGTLSLAWPTGPTSAGRHLVVAADSGIVRVASTPPGLRVFAVHHERDNPNVISRAGVLEDSSRGQSPMELRLAAGTNTVAIERVFPAGSAEMGGVPRGCIGNFSFSGSTVFFKCFKCTLYPAGAVTDSIDPYQRDGNIGVCFDAPTDKETPIRYFRLYSVVVDSVARSVNATFRAKPRGR